jgi:hypothetical protein
VGSGVLCGSLQSSLTLSALVQNSDSAVSSWETDPSQTVDPGGGAAVGEAPIVVSRCVAKPSRVVKQTPAGEDRNR